MNRIIKTTLLLLTAVTLSNTVYAADISDIKTPINLRVETNVANMDMVIKDGFVKSKYKSAENKFVQGNVRAAYDDFLDLMVREGFDGGIPVNEDLIVGDNEETGISILFIDIDDRENKEERKR